MRVIGYVSATAHRTTNLQIKQIEVAKPDVIVVEGKNRETIREAIQTLRDPGDTLVVPEMSVISRQRAELEAIATEILGKGFVILETVPGRRITDLESFLGGLWSAKRKGLSSKQARQNAAHSKGRETPRPKMRAAKKHWFDRTISVKEAERRAGVSAATMFREFGPSGRRRGPRREEAEQSMSTTRPSTVWVYCRELSVVHLASERCDNSAEDHVSLKAKDFGTARQECEQRKLKIWPLAQKIRT